MAEIAAIQSAPKVLKFEAQPLLALNLLRFGHFIVQLVQNESGQSKQYSGAFS
jgi:hypothetical protein